MHLRPCPGCESCGFEVSVEELGTGLPELLNWPVVLQGKEVLYERPGGACSGQKFLLLVVLFLFPLSRGIRQTVSISLYVIRKTFRTESFFP